MSQRPAAPFQEPVDLEIEPSEAGERIDKVLSKRLPEVSRATLQRWMSEGRVMSDGRPLSPKERARSPMRVRVEPAPPLPSEAKPEDIPLEVLYEDRYLIVVVKPAGLVVHPAAGHPSGTLVNALLYRSELGGGGDPQRPGVVHRLDKDTSGVMVVARDERTREGLSALFAAHDLDREYLAICQGSVAAEVTYRTWFGRHPSDRKRFSSKVSRGKQAVTHVRRERELLAASLVACRLETGRTHQIRVHLADHGHPIVGDPVYGRRSADKRLQMVAEQLGRQALHARVLGFAHPIDGRPLSFAVEPPADFRRALEALTPA